MVTLPLAFHFVRDFTIIIIIKSLADVFLIQHTWKLKKKRIHLKMVRILQVKHPKIHLFRFNSLLNWSTKLRVSLYQSERTPRPIASSWLASVFRASSRMTVFASRSFWILTTVPCSHKSLVLVSDSQWNFNGYIYNDPFHYFKRLLNNA